MNGRIGNKTWCKCECCAPMETSIGVCCLEIPEIRQTSFSGISCLNVYRSDPYFVLWFSGWENFVSYLISTQCWFLANQNKSFLSLQSSQLSFSLKRYILPDYLIRSFSLEERFLWVGFFKRASYWILGFRYYWKAYLIIWTTTIHRCPRKF